MISTERYSEIGKTAERGYGNWERLYSLVKTADRDLKTAQGIGKLCGVVYVFLKLQKEIQAMGELWALVISAERYSKEMGMIVEVCKDCTNEWETGHELICFLNVCL